MHSMHVGGILMEHKACHNVIMSFTIGLACVEIRSTSFLSFDTIYVILKIGVCTNALYFQWKKIHIKIHDYESQESHETYLFHGQ